MTHLQNCSLKIYLKIALGRGSGWGVRIDVNEELKFFVKIQKKKNLGGGGRVGLGGQGRCEQRSEVFVKIKKKMWGVGSWGGGGGSGWGSGWM